MKDVGGTGSDRHVGALTGCHFTHFNVAGNKKKKQRKNIISGTLRPEMHNLKKKKVLRLCSDSI